MWNTNLGTFSYLNSALIPLMLHILYTLSYRIIIACFHFTVINIQGEPFSGHHIDLAVHDEMKQFSPKRSENS